MRKPVRYCETLWITKYRRNPFQKVFKRDVNVLVPSRYHNATLNYSRSIIAYDWEFYQIRRAVVIEQF